MVCHQVRKKKPSIELLLFSEGLIRTYCIMKNSKDCKLDYYMRDQSKVTTKNKEIATLTVGPASTEGACPASTCSYILHLTIFRDMEIYKRE